MISVILPVYNAEKYLSEAIESVLNQTLKDFELICINDGSTDSSEFIIKKYQSLDSRIILISRDNKGLINTLNEGLKKAKYNFIARMDADDICDPVRFKLQLSYLQKHKEVAVVGTEFLTIDSDGVLIGNSSKAKSPLLIKSLLLFGCPVAHPTVMINRNLLGGFEYDHGYECAEDYELWCRVSEKYRIATLAVPLLKYRILDTSISRTRRKTQIESGAKSANKHFFPGYQICQDLELMYDKGIISIKLLSAIIFYQKIKRYIPFQILYIIYRLSKRDYKLTFKVIRNVKVD